MTAENLQGEPGTAAVPWAEFDADAPDLARRVWARFGANLHHVLATLRSDGAPRVSGTEVRLLDGDLLLGCMPGSVKGRDLRRDGRCALHAHPGDSTMADGDAKVSAVALEATGAAALARFRSGAGAPPGPFELYRLQLRDVVLTSVHPDGDRLVIERWAPGDGVRRTERA
jgi:hypothetical protein